MAEEAKERVQTASATAKHAFAVRRRDPELIGPSAPTPRDTKRLSDIDDQGTLRGHASGAFVYRGRAAPGDPAGVVRRALGEALVHYYPLAGRVREVEGRKLVVDCTGEGALFVEADADVRLAELELAGLRPPFPCMDQLLFDVEGSSGVLDSPLLLIQVTRLLCGGFVLAVRHNHTICDAIGVVQFLSAVAELARGLPAPTVAPAWSRDLLEARSPPIPSFPHREFDVLPPPGPPPLPPAADGMVVRSFTFTAADIVAIKKQLSPLLRDTSTTFEVLTAFLWRARSGALEVAPGEYVQLVFIANFRGFPELSLQAGYYGNACVPMTVLADADGSIDDAVTLVRQAKAAVTAEYVRSTLDVLVLRGRPCLSMQNNMFMVSDNRHAGFNRLDFGWGEPVYGGPTHTIFGLCNLVAVKDIDGQDAVEVPIVLPRPAMERFAAAVRKLCEA